MELAVNLSPMPVVTAVVTVIAAGNRVMLKPSKFAPATNAVLASMISEIFPEEQVTIVNGDGSAFSSLPFDHLVSPEAQTAMPRIATNVAGSVRKVCTPDTSKTRTVSTIAATSSELRDPVSALSRYAADRGDQEDRERDGATRGGDSGEVDQVRQHFRSALLVTGCQEDCLRVPGFVLSGG